MHSDEVKAAIAALYSSIGQTEEEFVANIQKNFTAQDVATIIMVTSVYAPLLDISKGIFQKLVLLEANNLIQLPTNSQEEMLNWAKDYQAIKDRTKFFNQKDTMQ